MNDLTTVDMQKFNSLLADSGVDGGEIQVPFLKVVYDAVMSEDGERVIGKPGSYYIKGGEQVYAQKIKMRVLTNHTQWRQTDPDTYKLVNKSILMTNLNQEARDMKGGIACGRPTGQAWKNMDEVARRPFSDIKCTRIVKGIVSYTGKTVTGEERTIENAPVQFFLTGWNYMPFDKAVRALKQNRKKFTDVWWDLSTHTEGKAHVTDWSPDFTTPAPITQELVETLEVFANQTSIENSNIEAAYRAAMMENQSSGELVDALLGDELESYE